MRARVVAVDAAAEHGDRQPRLERAAVRRSVDPARKPGDDDDSRRGQLAAERGGDGRAVRRTGAGSDDRDGRLLEQPERRVPPHEEARRRIVDRAQTRREPADPPRGTQRKPRRARSSRNASLVELAEELGEPRRCAARRPGARPIERRTPRWRARSSGQLRGRPVRERLREMLGPRPVRSRRARRSSRRPARPGHARGPRGAAAPPPGSAARPPSAVRDGGSSRSRRPAASTRSRTTADGSPARSREIARRAGAAAQAPGRSDRAARATACRGSAATPLGRAGALHRTVAARAARAEVHRRDELEPRREDDASGDADDRDVPVLERLAQRLERRPRELRELVEEEDAVVREGRLARAAASRRLRR